MKFQYPLNLHCSQTSLRNRRGKSLFQYPLNLHCSQTTIALLLLYAGFNTLWIYTALKQGKCGVDIPLGFNTLWIYTALKHRPAVFIYKLRFNTLWIYTALKPLEVIEWCPKVSIPSEFTLLSNCSRDTPGRFQFQYPLNLHCSQTISCNYCFSCSFNTLWIYTALKLCWCAI